jgi:hypothetical protein
LSLTSFDLSNGPNVSASSELEDQKLVVAAASLNFEARVLVLELCAHLINVLGSHQISYEGKPGTPSYVILVRTVVFLPLVKFSFADEADYATDEQSLMPE